MMHLCFENEKPPVQLRRECEELYLSWGATISYISLLYQSHWTLGQLTSKSDAEAFDSSHLLRAIKKLMQEDIFIVAWMQQKKIIQFPKTVLLEIPLFQD